MADQPDPPDQWRVYEGDDTPDPEPPQAGEAPKTPVVVRRRSGAGALIGVILAVVVLGVVVATAVAIFVAVGGGIDAKDPEDVAKLTETLEDERDSTEVYWVGLYTDYVIVDVPYSRDPGDTREISYRWSGGGLDESTKGTSTDQRFDLADLDLDVIDGMCDPVLDLAQGATEDDCYIFISKPTGDDTSWFHTSASDEFNRSFSIEYDENGVEVSRYVPTP
ncbi:hypothetical protein [Nocardioides antri]|uniref:Uncharacterized protein n=1 Tax=Nocardioides antri TaxID=2607659 RepID=A0A5B1M1A4_9ACTN|nr:hypothetical protein [Nocardioides antri]KAA1425889.1 hypothetical protein F0U47_16215 [Nocardioides antri]